MEKPSLLYLVVGLICCGSALADLSWGSFTAESVCERCSFRYYYAKLNGIPNGDKWEDYCPGNPATPANINGYNARAPDYCYTGYTGIYGYFEVPDPACDCHWGPSSDNDTFVDNGCQTSGDSRGYHEYQANLGPQNFRSAADARFFCETNPATINGLIYFQGPSRCETRNVGVPIPGGIAKAYAIGYFEVENADCDGTPYPHPDSRRRLLAARDSVSNTSSALPTAARKLLGDNDYFGRFPSRYAMMQGLLNADDLLEAALAIARDFARSTVPPASGDNHVTVEDRGDELGIFNGDNSAFPVPPASSRITLPGRVIPVVSDRPLYGGGNQVYLGGPNNDQIPAAVNGGYQRADAGYIQIPLADSSRPDGATLLLTQRLTGCTVAVGVQDGQVYIAHVQPRDPGEDGENINQAYAWHYDRATLADGLSRGQHFEGVTIDNPSHYITIGGNSRRQGGYELGNAQIRVFASREDVSISIIVTVGNDPNEQLSFTRFFSLSRVAGTRPDDNSNSGSGSGGLAPRDTPPEGWNYPDYSLEPNTGDTDSKPLKADCQSAVGALNTSPYDQECYADNCDNDLCSTKASAGTCSIKMCKAACNPDVTEQLPCKQIADMAQELIDIFTDGDHTGGLARGLASNINIDVQSNGGNSVNCGTGGAQELPQCD